MILFIGAHFYEIQSFFLIKITKNSLSAHDITAGLADVATTTQPCNMKVISTVARSYCESISKCSGIYNFCFQAQRNR